MPRSRHFEPSISFSTSAVSGGARRFASPGDSCPPSRLTPPPFWPAAPISSWTSRSRCCFCSSSFSRCSFCSCCCSLCFVPAACRSNHSPTDSGARSSCVARDAAAARRALAQLVARLELPVRRRHVDSGTWATSTFLCRWRRLGRWWRVARPPPDRRRGVGRTTIARQLVRKLLRRLAEGGPASAAPWPTPRAPPPSVERRRPPHRRRRRRRQRRRLRAERRAWRGGVLLIESTSTFGCSAGGIPMAAAIVRA